MHDRDLLIHVAAMCMRPNEDAEHRAQGAKTAKASAEALLAEFGIVVTRDLPEATGLSRGIDPNAPLNTIESLHEENEALRAENEDLRAKLSQLGRDEGELRETLDERGRAAHDWEEPSKEHKKAVRSK